MSKTLAISKRTFLIFIILGLLALLSISVVSGAAEGIDLIELPYAFM